MAIDKVARPYAKTLIEHAEEAGKIDQIVEDIETIKSALKNRDLELLFMSPIVNTKKKMDIIKAIFTGKISDISLNFLLLVLRKNRESFISDIIEASEAFILEIKDITEVTITTAAEVSDDTIKKIEELVKSFGQTRSNLRVKHRIDKSILGGFIVEFEGKIINASIAHKLKELRRSFN